MNGTPKIVYRLTETHFQRSILLTGNLKKFEKEVVKMNVLLLVIGIGIVIYHLCKDSASDAACRKHAQENGLDFYASSTGLRNTKTGEKYYK